jgi:transposase-like protein
MSRQRKTLSGPEKLAILKRYLREKVPISDLCDEHTLQPSQVYYWQAQLFEHGASSFERKPGRKTDADSRAQISSSGLT